jgi:hypothetical protein
MSPVFRISRDETRLKVEQWVDWLHFDQSREVAFGNACDIATAVSSFGECAGGTGVYEFQRIQVRNGHIAWARELLVESLPAWAQNGATMLGAFEVVHGEHLPALGLLLFWDSFTSATTAQKLIEHDRRLTSGRALLREDRGKEPIQSTLRLFRQELLYVRYPHTVNTPKWA